MSRTKRWLIASAVFFLIFIGACATTDTEGLGRMIEKGGEAVGSFLPSPWREIVMSISSAIGGLFYGRHQVKVAMGVSGALWANRKLKEKKATEGVDPTKKA